MNHEEHNLDPYLHWLGIRDPERPPNHYRMLGIELFESDLDVIANAADRQMAHVRTYQSGKNAELSQQILNEISTAKVCLLDADEKLEYDGALQTTIQVSAPPSSSITDSIQIDTDPTSYALNQPQRGNRAANRALLITVIAVPLLLIGGVVAWWWGFFDPSDGDDQTADLGEPAQKQTDEADPPEVPPEKRDDNDSSVPPSEVKPEPIQQTPVDVPTKPEDDNEDQPSNGSGTNGQDAPKEPDEAKPADPSVAPWDVPVEKTNPFKIKDTSSPITEFVLALSTRNPLIARAIILKGFASDIVLTADQIDQLQIFTAAHQQFWDSVNRTAAALRPSNTIVFRNQPVAVVQVANDSIQLQAQNTERKTFSTSVRTIDPDFAIALVLHDHRNQKPTAWRLIACFLSMDHQGSVERSKKYLQMAKQSGMSVTSIESVLDFLSAMADPQSLSVDDIEVPPIEAFAPAKIAVRQRVPGPAAMRVAIGQLKERAGIEIKTRTPVGRRTTIGQLTAYLDDEKNSDPILRYAALDLLRKLSFKQSDIQTCLQTISAICEDYEHTFDDLAEATWRESNLSRSVDEGELLLAIEDLMYRQLIREQFSTSAAMIKFAKSHVADGNPIHESQLRQMQADLAEAVKLSKKARAGLKVISQEDKDESANRAIGSYLCFVRQDFRQGLPYLLRANDKLVKELAMRDLLSNPRSRPNRQLAQGWQQMANTYSGIAKRAMIKRAQYWSSST